MTYSLIHETLLQFAVAFRTQVPATGPQPEPNKSGTPSPSLAILLHYTSLRHSAIYALGFQVVSFV